MTFDGLKWMEMKKSCDKDDRFNKTLLKILHVGEIQQPWTSRSCRYLASSKIERYHIPMMLARAIVDSFACTNSTSAVKFLHVGVSNDLYLPLAELDLQWIEFTCLQVSEVGLDRCR